MNQGNACSKERRRSFDVRGHCKTGRREIHWEEDIFDQCHGCSPKYRIRDDRFAAQFQFLSASVEEPGVRLSPSIPRGQRRRAGESRSKTGVSQADCNDCCFHDPLLLNGLGFDLTLQQDCFPCDFLNVGAAGFYSPFRFCTRICKPLRFWRVLSFWQIGPPPQPLLWKCGKPRSVRVPKLRGQREDLRVSITLFRPRLFDICLIS